MAATVDGIGELLEGAVASGALPGAAVVVVDRDGAVAHETAGLLRVGGEAPVTTDTTFRYASMTKGIASVAALQLVEQDRVGLDDPVSQHLPEAADWQVLDGWDGDTPRLRAPATAPTVRQLLTHTSGHGYFFTNAELARFHEATGLVNGLTGQRAGLTTPLVHDPGTTWEYGISTDWAGLLVEAVSGQSLDAYLAEHVFGPLGITSMTFSPDADLRERMMPIHHRAPDGSLVAGDFDLPPEPEWWAAGHGLHGTAQDFGRFLLALLRDGDGILRPETVELAFSDHLRGAAVPDMIRSAVPDLSNDIPTLPHAQGWGLGFHLTLEDLPGMRRAGSGDWAGLFNSYYWVDRTSGVAAVLLTQVLPFFDLGVVGTLVGVEQAVYAGR